MQHLAFIPYHVVRSTAGFTLLELLVTLAIVALSLVAAPSLARIVQ